MGLYVVGYRKTGSKGLVTVIHRHFRTLVEARKAAVEYLGWQYSSLSIFDVEYAKGFETPGIYWGDVAIHRTKKGIITVWFGSKGCYRVYNNGKLGGKVKG